MLKFIILLVLLFLYIRKDRYEGIDNISDSDTEGEIRSNSSSETKPSSEGEKIASLKAKLDFDSKIFDYLIGGGAGFLVGLGVGIAYHVIHTYDDDSSPSS